MTTASKRCSGICPRYSTLDEQPDQVGSRVEAELLEEDRLEELCGARGDLELLGDLVVAVAEQEEVEAGARAGRELRGPRQALERLVDEGRHLGGAQAADGDLGGIARLAPGGRDADRIAVARDHGRRGSPLERTGAHRAPLARRGPIEEPDEASGPPRGQRAPLRVRDDLDQGPPRPWLDRDDVPPHPAFGTVP